LGSYWQGRLKNECPNANSGGAAQPRLWSGEGTANTTVNEKQKTVMKTRTNTWLLSIGLAAVAIILMPTNSSAQEKGTAKGGATQLMKSVRTPQDLGELKPGDMMVMSCPKCKNVTVTYVEPTFKATETKEKVTAQHTCPGCATTTTVEGHGKAKKDVLKHVCMTCGSKDAFCCVLKKGSNPTKGMEKEAK
jgi:ribosomal protein S27E